jgi:hypothetical protein
MSKHQIEVKRIVFDFVVNNNLVSIVYTESSRTIVIFKGITVYTSRHSVQSIKQAEEMLYRYLESINIS